MDELQKKPKRTIVGLTVEEMTPEEVVSLRVLEPKLMDRLYQLTTELKMESPYFKNYPKMDPRVTSTLEALSDYDALFLDGVRVSYTMELLKYLNREIPLLVLPESCITAF